MLIYAIRENTWCPGYGWGNGYVFLPKGHKYYGVHYGEIEIESECPGGLTYGKHWRMGNLSGLIFPEGIMPAEDTPYWVIGFDTAHCSMEDTYHTTYSKENVTRITKAIAIELSETLTKACADCHYYATPLHCAPCDICREQYSPFTKRNWTVRGGGEEAQQKSILQQKEDTTMAEQKRTCMNCRYAQTGAEEEPCNTCTRSGSLCQWLPADVTPVSPESKQMTLNDKEQSIIDMLSMAADIEIAAIKDRLALNKQHVQDAARLISDTSTVFKLPLHERYGTDNELDLLYQMYIKRSNQLKK